uniref:Sodium/potassium-transporting ATPase subunit beta n=1 Tax=Salarias fasciatus TaxID=181472 RepID=A0A672GGX3_SALFA
MSSSAPTQNQEPGQEPDREPGQEPDREPDQKPEQDPGDKKDAAQEEKTEEVKEEKAEEEKKERTEEKKKEVKEVKEPAMGFIYNRRTGEFLGRTASSWGLILLFYLVFYGFLAAMFLLTMWVMLLTLDDNVPKHQDRVPSPGLVIRPHAAEISFNRSNPADYSGYVQQLHQFLQPYEDSRQEQNELCLVGEYTLQDGEPLKKACQFKRSLLRYCSGLSDTSFGYSDGKPCVLIKMNRVGPLLHPSTRFTSSSLHPLTSLLHLRLSADHRPEGNAPLEMLYFPSDGRIDKMFFPYYGKKAHPDYVQPLVAVKLLLTKEDYNVEQTVECKLEGSDLRNNDDRDKSLGRVIFRVKVFQ